MLGLTQVTPHSTWVETNNTASTKNEEQLTLSNLTFSTCLGCYTDPLKSKRTTVWLKPEGGLYARIDHLATNGVLIRSDDDLPLVGIPKEIACETNIAKLLPFLHLTHLIPEKGIEGVFNRVSVHISGKGGVKPLIPYQPGLALGSVIKGEVLDKMEEYAETRAQLQALEEQFNSIENQITALELKINVRVSNYLKPELQELELLRKTLLDLDVLNDMARIRAENQKHQEIEETINKIEERFNTTYVPDPALTAWNAKLLGKISFLVGHIKGLRNDLKMLIETWPNPIHASTLTTEEIDQRANIMAKVQKLEKMDALLSVWIKQKDQLVKFLGEIGKKMIPEKPATTEQPKNEIVFANFQQGTVSPIDMKATVTDVQIRGFDSMRYNSTYIRQDQHIEDIHDQVSEMAAASAWSGFGFDWNTGAVWGAHTATDAIASRTFELAKADNTEGVLVINASVTTRNVRTLTNIKYDLIKLKSIHHLMTNQPVPPVNTDINNNNNQPTVLSPEAIAAGISELGGEKCIYILTEAVMGGSFTAFVSFMNKNANEQFRNLNKNAHTSSHSDWYDRGVRGRDVGSSSLGTNGEIDLLSSKAQTTVNIEFTSQGVLPQFTRYVIEREIMKHLDLNPANYELAPEDEADVNTYYSTDLKDVMKRQMKLDTAQNAIYNTFRGLVKNKESQNIHTMESVYKAYENFATQITGDKNCGVPVGFYYEVLTQSRIEEIINQLEKNTQ